MKRGRAVRGGNAFAKRRRGNMRAGETPAQARARLASDGRCRDCGGALPEDGADRPPSAGQLKTVLLLCADRGVERDAPATERAAHELIKALAALPRRRGAAVRDFVRGSGERESGAVVVGGRVPVAAAYGCAAGFVRGRFGQGCGPVDGEGGHKGGGGGGRGRTGCSGSRFASRRSRSGSANGLSMCRLGNWRIGRSGRRIGAIGIGTRCCRRCAMRTRCGFRSRGKGSSGGIAMAQADGEEQRFSLWRWTRLPGSAGVSPASAFSRARTGETPALPGAAVTGSPHRSRPK